MRDHVDTEQKDSSWLGPSVKAPPHHPVLNLQKLATLVFRNPNITQKSGDQKQNPGVEVIKD